MNRIKLVCHILFICVLSAQTQELPLLKISQDNHFMVTGNQEPFFWLGGTAWELLHRLNEKKLLNI